MNAALAIAKATPLAVRRERALRDQAETLFQARVRAAIRGLRDAIQVAPLARTLRERGPVAPLPVLPFALFTARLRRELLRTFRDTYESAGDRVAAELKGRLLGKEVSFRTRVTSWGFDVLNDRGLRYLQEHAADRVVGIADGTRNAMRTLIAELYQAGTPPLQQAQRIKAYIGLTEPHARAVENLRATLVDQGVGAARLEALVAKKVRQLTELRALTIARTESAFASAAATRESLQQAADEGLFEPASARRVWRTAEDELANKCPICGPMDGQESEGLDGTFTTGEGEEISDAPAHPACRCVTELVI